MTVRTGERTSIITRLGLFGAKMVVKGDQVVPITGKWILEAIKAYVHNITHIEHNDITNLRYTINTN